MGVLRGLLGWEAIDGKAEHGKQEAARRKEGS